MNIPIVHISNLYKKYHKADFFSVNDLSLSINQGEIFGLLGPNGAGKTTLISMLCGLFEPTAGQLTINGLTYQKNAHQLKKIIGVVPQEYALYPTLTALENVMFFGSMYGIKPKQLEQQAKHLLTELGLEKFIHKKIETFSGGMKRRVNLIAGILHQPEILFLDEPTVGVDVQSQQAILAFLKMLNTNGTTIIYTSHHLKEAENFCTRIAIIEAGKIFCENTPQQLIASVPNAKSIEDVFIAITGNNLRDA
ncbi:ABC transporter ATP-binding protein [Flavobacterium agricola]|uniref:ABC transporter ATP-binding protein n=1 Tax=Flavobacterium agricola TaxID=2870839 RepID=A0ABY6M004_9FLAO|nr:ABC transporter ATP-binding protein [Flavobacterium agricola]UYW00999.1 ABC transporter ATP-binding protein [Flavobacterium agricola]